MAAVPDTLEVKSTGRRPGWAAWLLIAPLVFWLGLFVIAPVAIMLLYSFSKPAPLGGVTWEFSLDAYRRILNATLVRHLFWASLFAVAGGAVFLAVGLALGRAWVPVDDWVRRRWKLLVIAGAVLVGWGALRHSVARDPQAGPLKIFADSIDYAAWSTAICVLIAYPVGYFIGRAPVRWRNMLLVLVMVPFWTSFLIRTYAWVTILKSEGVLNGTLLWMRVISEPLDLLYTPTAVMIGLVYTYLPFMILPIYTSCERLDQSLIEASFDLGANPFRSFWTVILPLTWPGVMAGIVITFVPAIGMFAVNDILGGKTQPLVGNVITDQFGKARNWPYGAALGMVMMVMFIATYYLSIRKRGTIVG